MGETLDYLEANAEGSELADFTDYDSALEDFSRPTQYRHPPCEWWKAVKQIKAWRGEKRKCPCCGRMIYARMEFAIHGDQRKSNDRPLSPSEKWGKDAKRKRGCKK